MVALAADLSVMADALRLLVGGPQLVYVLLFGVFCVVTQIFMRYTRYVAVLKWTTLSLFAYFGAVLMVEVSWREVAAAMLRPPLMFEGRYIATMVAIFGVALRVANLVGLAIIITAGTTLHLNGVTEVQTSAQAAEVLRPVAGVFPSPSSRSVSSGPNCAPSRCWPAPPPLRSRKRLNGRSASRGAL